MSKTNVPILYMDLTMRMFQSAPGFIQDNGQFHTITVGAYQMMGRLEDIPFTTDTAIRASDDEAV